MNPWMLPRRRQCVSLPDSVVIRLQTRRAMPLPHLSRPVRSRARGVAICVASAILLSSAACTDEGAADVAAMASAANVPTIDGVVDGGPPASDSSSVDTVDQSTPQAADETGSAGSIVITDSVISVPMIKGRTTRDSLALVRAIRAGRNAPGWPVQGPPAAAGAILPGKRIVAFYGNPLSRRMGVLGEYPVDEMLAMLDKEVAAWEKADPSTPVVPALHLVATVAQADPGRGNTYRLRMDSTLIGKVYDWARSRNGLLFLDVQTGWSTIQDELPRLLPWLENPDVHLGIDPEFNMHGDRQGVKPGAKIGTYDEKDINYVIRTLGKLSAEKNIPPKVLVIHRFTRKMVTNSSAIRLDPHVQVVMDMDGWGPPWLKFDSYRDFIISEPVQYTGFKLFYKNDVRKGDPLLTPRELVLLHPAPMYIQYQ